MSEVYAEAATGVEADNPAAEAANVESPDSEKKDEYWERDTSVMDLYSAYADVVAPCHWAGGAVMKLRDAIVLHPGPWTEEGAPLIKADIMLFKANEIQASDNSESEAKAESSEETSKEAEADKDPDQKESKEVGDPPSSPEAKTEPTKTQAKEAATQDSNVSAEPSTEAASVNHAIADAGTLKPVNHQPEQPVKEKPKVSKPKTTKPAATRVKTTTKPKLVKTTEQPKPVAKEIKPANRPSKAKLSQIQPAEGAAVIAENPELVPRTEEPKAIEVTRQESVPELSQIPKAQSIEVKDVEMLGFDEAGGADFEDVEVSVLETSAVSQQPEQSSETEIIAAHETVAQSLDMLEPELGVTPLFENAAEVSDDEVIIEEVGLLEVEEQLDLVASRAGDVIQVSLDVGEGALIFQRDEPIPEPTLLEEPSDSNQETKEVALLAEKVEPIVIEITQHIERLEPDQVEPVNDTLAKIVETAKRVEVAEEEDAITTEEAQAELDKLFTELLNHLGLECAPEQIESLAKLTIAKQSNGGLKRPQALSEDEDLMQGVGTHELLKTLLHSNSDEDRPVVYAPVIGRSALRLSFKLAA